MNNEELKSGITELLPAAIFTEDSEWLTITIESPDWMLLAEQLRQNPELEFDYLFCLTCVDWKTHLMMHYHLSSTKYRHTIVVKCQLDRAEPVMETASKIWRTAEFHEREVYELFGVHFLHHPDLRRLVLTDNFDGWPLRKDFEDPVNMIKL